MRWFESVSGDNNKQAIVAVCKSAYIYWVTLLHDIMLQVKRLETYQPSFKLSQCIR
jgi:hypothetical protein